MAEKILLLDDDENILHGYHRVLRSEFSLDVALGGVQALQALEHHGPYAVLVADMKMPGMSGLEVLAEARNRWPETIRIMLTGNADQKTAVDAVNEGRVFRFLTKPCRAEELALAIRAGIRQYRLERAEKDLLEQTLTGSIQLLSELMGVLAPSTFSRCWTLRRRCARIGRILGCEHVWEIEVAALLAPIGWVAMPKESPRGDPSLTSIKVLMDRVPEIGARMLNSIPRMEQVAEIIRYQAKGYDGSGLPADEVAGTALPLGARILKATADFTDLESSRKSWAVAFEELRLHPRSYDPSVLDALAQCLSEFPGACGLPRNLPLSSLSAGMILASPVVTRQGHQVCVPGLCLGIGHLELLRIMAEFGDLQEPIAVFTD